MADWLSQFWDAISSISLGWLVLGLTLQTGQTLLVALAWRNILRAAYPDGDVTYRPILSYYAGGVGLNSILPASAGTVAMLGLFRTTIPGSTVAGLVGATLVENIFFAVVAVLVYAWLFLGVAGSFEVELGWFSDHAAATVIIVVAGSALIVVTCRLLWRRMQRTWANAKEGGAILGQPRRFMAEVVGVEAISYASRMGVNAVFMAAYGVPVSVQNVFLIVAASSLSSTVAIAPGAVGAQTALASVVLKGVAPQAVISAYTVGQALITTGWNAIFGLTLLSRAIGWEKTRALMRVRKKERAEAEKPELEGGDAAADHESHRPSAVLHRLREHRLRHDAVDEPAADGEPAAAAVDLPVALPGEPGEPRDSTDAAP